MLHMKMGSTDTTTTSTPQAMNQFTPQERSMYLRFVWGRSRLPLTSKDFERKHTIELLRTSNPDGSLPLAHTWYAESAPHVANIHSHTAHLGAQLLLH